MQDQHPQPRGLLDKLAPPCPTPPHGIPPPAPRLHLERGEQIDLVGGRNLRDLRVLAPQQLPHVLQYLGIVLVGALAEDSNQGPRQGTRGLPVNPGVGARLVVPTTSKLDHVRGALVVFFGPTPGIVVRFRRKEHGSHGLQTRHERHCFVPRQVGQPSVGKAVHHLEDGKEGGKQGGREGGGGGGSCVKRVWRIESAVISNSFQRFSTSANVRSGQCSIPKVKTTWFTPAFPVLFHAC